MRNSKGFHRNTAHQSPLYIALEDFFFKYQETENNTFCAYKLHKKQAGNYCEKYKRPGFQIDVYFHFLCYILSDLKFKIAYIHLTF